jgi:hypothetical protein
MKSFNFSAIRGFCKTNKIAITQATITKIVEGYFNPEPVSQIGKVLKCK